MIGSFLQLFGLLTIIVIVAGLVARSGNHETRIKTLETKREPDGAANDEVKH